MKEKTNLLKKKAIALSMVALLAGISSGCSLNNEEGESKKHYLVIKSEGNAIVMEIKNFENYHNHQYIYLLNGEHIDTFSQDTFYFTGYNAEKEAYHFAEVSLGENGEIRDYNEDILSLKK